MTLLDDTAASVLVNSHGLSVRRVTHAIARERLARKLHHQKLGLTSGLVSDWDNLSGEYQAKFLRQADGLLEALYTPIGGERHA